MTLLKLDKNQQKERENVNTTDLALTYIRKPRLCPHAAIAMANSTKRGA